MSDAQHAGRDGLTTPISQGDWRLMFLQHDRIKEVTPEDLVRVAKAYFKASNRRWAYYIPDAAPDRTAVPDTPELEPLLTNYKSSVAVIARRSVRPHAGQYRKARGARASWPMA